LLSNNHFSSRYNEKGLRASGALFFLVTNDK